MKPIKPAARNPRPVIHFAPGTFKAVCGNELGEHACLTRNVTCVRCLTHIHAHADYYRRQEQSARTK